MRGSHYSGYPRSYCILHFAQKLQFLHIPITILRLCFLITLGPAKYSTHIVNTQNIRWKKHNTNEELVSTS